MCTCTSAFKAVLADNIILMWLQLIKVHSNNVILKSTVHLKKYIIDYNFNCGVLFSITLKY